MTTAGGYDKDIFLNPTQVEIFICSICQGITDKATSIGCTEDHVFCRRCLEEYFSEVPNKECPNCREPGMNISGVHMSKTMDRLINNFNVRCRLQYEQELNDVRERKCSWTGKLSDLYNHIEKQCPWHLSPCPYCNVIKRRYEQDEHDKQCPDKLTECPLKCNVLIQRKLMTRHTKNDCPNTVLNCDDCTQAMKRKEMKHHKSQVCVERMISCPFLEFGCNAMIKCKNLDRHLATNKVMHLEAKVVQMETIIKELQRNPITTHIKNNANLDVSRQQQYKLLVLSKTQKAYICSVDSKQAETIHVESFIVHNKYCMTTNVRSSIARKTSFRSESIPSRIVYGVSKYAISSLCLETKQCKSFAGDIALSSFCPIWSETHGLLVVGGEDIHRRGNKNLYGIQFNQDTYSLHTLCNLPYSAVWPSCCILRENPNGKERLFVCGGWEDNSNLSTCYVRDLEANRWKKLCNMIHGHQCGGICEWKERGNKIIVAAGYDTDTTNKFVEEYDMHNDIWMDLPRLNKKHESYPVLMPVNNVLYCIGGVNKKHDHLGWVERYDSRDNTNKWQCVDTVQQYFNIGQDGGAGYNCFLTL